MQATMHRAPLQALCRTVRPSRSLSTARSSLSRYVEISPEVQDALANRKALVALETAITSHGLPYEQAVRTARSLDRIIRKGGAVPVVIGLIDGIVKIGMQDSEIERLANSSTTQKRGKWKVGKRDIASAILSKVDGGTTVSATSFLSHLAGIDIFVTGGIGGVHRGAQQSMDISSDLTELGRTPTAVICAGAKSILDIGLTLEYLETLGVTVTTYGPTKDFPAFYARKSGFEAPSNVQTPQEAAELIHISRTLRPPNAQGQSGTLIGVPIPEEYEAKSKEIQKAVEQAVRDSVECGMAARGKEVTPWILARVKELSGGQSVESNIALIENNAKIGSAISVEFARLCSESPHTAYAKRSLREKSASHGKIPFPTSNKKLAVIGAAAVDIVSQPITTATDGTERPARLTLKTTVPGRTALKLGGVARNVHEAACKVGAQDAVLIAPIGPASDALSSVIMSGLSNMQASAAGLISMPGATPSVNMLLNAEGTVEVGVAATQLVEDLSEHGILDKLRRISPEIVCFDGNLSVEAMHAVLEHCRTAGITSIFEPTSDEKALKLLKGLRDMPNEPILDHVTPNVQELKVLAASARSTWPDLTRRQTRAKDFMNLYLPSPWLTPDIIADVLCLLRFASTIWLKAGEQGLCVFQLPLINGKPSLEAAPHMSYFPPLLPGKIVNSLGAGDSLLGGVLAGLSRGLDPCTKLGLDGLVTLGQQAAIATLQSADAVGDLQHLRNDLEKLIARER